MERNKCPICGKFTPFRKNKFCTYCSKECAYISPLRDLHSKQTKLEKYGDANYHNQEKIKQTCLERYGVTSFSKTKDFNKKVKKTLLERYGSETYNNQEKSKKTKLERYGSETYNNHIKAKQTCLERYGDEKYNLFGSKSFKENLKNKYGNENYNNEEKRKETLIQNHGVPYYSQSTEYKSRIQNIWIKRMNTLKKNKTSGYSQPEEDLHEIIKQE